MKIDGLFESMAEASEKKAEASENDYINEAGLLCCGKCHTPKQMEIEYNGKKFKPVVMCKCEQEKADKEEAERVQRQKVMETNRLRNMGFPDAEMRNCTFEKDDRTNEKLSSVAHKYVDNFSIMLKRGKGLLLFGNVGSGKTFIASCIANALIDEGYPCLVTNFARLTNTLSGLYEGKQAYIDSLNEFSLIVIDDLASERDTEYMNEIVMNIIDARYRSGLPVIITTNLTADEIKNPAEIRKQRIYSRLLEMCVPVEVKGTDRRKERLKEDYKEMKELLGL